MKKLLFLFCLILTSMLYAQSNADDILGNWYTNKEKTGAIVIFKYKGKYYGKALFGPEVNNLDVKNPNPELRSRKLRDIIILNNFSFNSDKKKYLGGKVYNTRDGKTYKSWMRLKDKNNLELHGYVGFSLLGKSVFWTRKK